MKLKLLFIGLMTVFALHSITYAQQIDRTQDATVVYAGLPTTQQSPNVVPQQIIPAPRRNMQPYVQNYQTPIYQSDCFSQGHLVTVPTWQTFCYRDYRGNVYEVRKIVGFHSEMVYDHPVYSQPLYAGRRRW